jgi:hypothetical protein
VPCTNDPAEQPHRMVKLQMKIGGCWRSMRTAARYYLGTARNHGIHPLDALRDALAGTPWMPPLNGYCRRTGWPYGVSGGPTDSATRENY